MSNDAVRRFEQRQKDKLKKAKQEEAGGMLVDARGFVDEFLVSELKQRYQCLSETPGKFKAGDIVVWKPGMNNRGGLPESANIMVVTAVMEIPVMDSNFQLLNALGGEAVDLKVGVIVPNPGVPGRMDFVELTIDSRRVVLYQKEESNGA